MAGLLDNVHIPGPTIFRDPPKAAPASAPDALDQILAAPVGTTPASAPAMDPLDQILSAAPTPAPTIGGIGDPLDAILAAPTQAQYPPGQTGPGTGPGIMQGGPVADVKAAWQWAKDNPQLILDFAMQSIGTAGGAMLGAPGGPAAQIPLAAGGSVAGKKFSRWLTSADQPDFLEGSIDAAGGAFGPAVGSVARGASRLATGMSRGPIKEIERETAKSLGKVEARLGRGDIDAASADTLMAQLEATSGVSKGAAIDDAVKAALDKARNRSMTEAAVPGAIIGGLSLEPVTGMLLGAGVSEGVLKVALPKLLNSDKWAPRFAAWALNVEKGAIKKTELAGSFMALLSEAGIVGVPEPPRERARPKPLQERSMAPRGSDGRFTSRGNPFSAALRELEADQ